MLDKILAEGMCDTCKKQITIHIAIPASIFGNSDDSFSLKWLQRITAYAVCIHDDGKITCDDCQRGKKLKLVKLE